MSLRLRLVSLLSGSILSLVGAQAAAQASFTPVGDLPGGAFESYATDVSDDGSVVVGFSKIDTSPTEAFRWDATNGIVGLGHLSGVGSTGSRAHAVSGDGTTVVGASEVGADIPFSWTAAGGMVSLGGLPGESAGGQATGVSFDGAVTTGWSRRYIGIPTLNWEAFRRDGSGMVGIGHLGTGVKSFAFDISRNGQIVVGYSFIASVGEEAFVWDATNGMVGLGGLSTSPSRAEAVSDDGRVIVGYSNNGMGSGLPVLWDAPGNPTPLPPLPGGNGAGTAYGVSADGTVVCGRALAASGFPEAFVWSAATGTQAVADVLTQAGVDLTGWTLVEASAISGDGSTLVGYGTNPTGDTEGFVATLPPGFGAPTVPISGPLGLALMAAATVVLAARSLRR